MRQLKIAYLLPNMDVSGGVAVVFQHTNRLRKKGHDVVVATCDGIPVADWFPGQSVPLVTAARLPEDLDILVATSWSTAFAVSRLKAQHKCYFVQSDETRFHDRGNDFFHITHLTYLMNYHYLTEAKWIQKWLLENFDKHAALIPNGLDEDIFHQVEPLSPKGNRFRILLEGSIGLPYKGMKDAFEVVGDMDVEVWCVSSFGKPQPGWKCDRFFEKIPIEKMREIYSSCDILLKLSRVEGFFGPPMEMMACGGVCVVGKVTGHDEYVVDGENALVVDPFDIAQARAAVARLMDDEALREKLRRNGMETAKRWNWTSSIDTLEKYFMEITDNKDRAFSAVREQTNQSISHFYEKIMSTPFSSSVIAHRVGNKIKTRKIKNLLKTIYFQLRKLKRTATLSDQQSHQ
jgi:glycosyltransferase involved in cell wall biosynthesis